MTTVLAVLFMFGLQLMGDRARAEILATARAK